MDRSTHSTSFYNRDVCTVAEELIGCLMVRARADGPPLIGRIVETEAYRHDEPASHSFNGQTARNRAMFGPPGHAYVYLIYGVHSCFNVVCGPQGTGDAVLIRAVEPRAGLPEMWVNRYGTPWVPGERPDRQVRLLTAGPGRLASALAITREEVDGTSLESGPVVLMPREAEPGEIVQTTRIGISRAVELKWRFVEAGSPFLSRAVG
jgi:DNA-3-methyladenine glycosylase